MLYVGVSTNPLFCSRTPGEYDSVRAGAECRVPVGVILNGECMPAAPLAARFPMEVPRMSAKPEMSREERMAFILDHREKPRNNHLMDDASVAHTGGNPGCGDILTIYLKVGDDERIEDISFTGEGCTISQAGASILSGQLKGKTLAEVESMDFDVVVDTFGRDVMATRPRCATLALGTTKTAVKKYRDKTRKEALTTTSSVSSVSSIP